jgi:membrane protein DedA with SNARE-associated domain
VLAGFFLGENWTVVERYADMLQWVVIVAVVVAIGTFVVLRLRERSAGGSTAS